MPSIQRAEVLTDGFLGPPLVSEPTGSPLRAALPSSRTSSVEKSCVVGDVNAYVARLVSCRERLSRMDRGVPRAPRYGIHHGGCFLSIFVLRPSRRATERVR